MTDMLKNDAGTGRRDFIKGAAVTGMLGAAGILAQSTAAAQQEAQEAVDPQAPPGLKPYAEPDCRFPLFYEDSGPIGFKLVMQYFAALSRRDAAAMATTLQYPFLTYEGPKPVIVESKDQFMSDPPRSMNVTGKGANWIRPGSYDIMENVEMVIFHPNAVGFSLTFNRYRADGHQILTNNLLLGVTNDDGHWGIEYLSSIFQPAELAYANFDEEDAVRALHFSQRNHALARVYSDVRMLRKNAFPVPSCSVMFGGSTGNAAPAHLKNTPMTAYRVKGVKSRIMRGAMHPMTEEQINNPTQEQLDAGAKAMAEYYTASGDAVGPLGFPLEFAGPKGKGTRAIFATTDKCHIVSGFTRYTPDGSLISETRWMGALCYDLQHELWVSGDTTGIFGQVMWHEHAGDVLPEGI